MLQILLSLIVVSNVQDDDIDFSGFNFSNTGVIRQDIPPPFFPAQFLPSDIKKREEDAKPFIMTDIGGRRWQSTDKKSLEDFINKENNKLLQELNCYLRIR